MRDTIVPSTIFIAIVQEVTVKRLQVLFGNLVDVNLFAGLPE
jgi:hypothetical protein